MSWVATRWRVVVAGAVVLALVATVGVWVVVQSNTAPSDAVDCSTLEAEGVNEAAVLADACAADVEVLAERTPWQSSFATADHQSRLEMSAIPSQVQVNGKWVAPDDSLVKDDKSGMVKVTAPVYPMQLNAGGIKGKDKPLGSITRDGHQFDVWFPLDLPEPKLTDSQAVYQLGKGIRLLVAVNVDGTGFLPVVELSDAKAAALFKTMLDAARTGSENVSSGLEIEFATEYSEGLRLTVDESNSVHILDAHDEIQFTAAAPLMWDSAGELVPVLASATEGGNGDRTRSPSDGDHVVQMPVRLAGDTIVVAPDGALVASADTVWPIFIDPGFAGHTATKRVAVRTGYFTGTLDAWTNTSSTQIGQGTGYCNVQSWCTHPAFYQRLAWQFTSLTTLAGLAQAEVTEAKFKVWGEHSSYCVAHRTTLHRTSNIGGFTHGASNWASLVLQPSTGYPAYGFLDQAQRDSCAAGGRGFREFDMLGIAKWAADTDSSVINVALIVDQTNMNAWKRFRNDATISVTYNRTPDVPSNRLLSPGNTPCSTGANRPVITTTTPLVSAMLNDADGTNTQVRYELAELSNLSVLKWSTGYQPAVAPWTLQWAQVTSGLVDGGVYAWRARAYDGALESAWSGWCEFAVDMTAPQMPTVVPNPTYSGVKAVYTEDVERGGVGLLGRFTLGPNGSTDVVSYHYGFNDPLAPSQTSPVADPLGIPGISYTPSTTGTVTLTVRARDRAGNMSPARTYIFKVATAIEDAVWMLDEGTGTTGAGSPGIPLTLANDTTWVEGPHELFQSRPGDHALKFDATGESATTAAPIVDTTKSFVVSAHVLLDQARVGTGDFTALSQDGTVVAGFGLGYTASCPGMTGGCWSFTMPDNSTAAGLSQTTGFATVQSTVPVKGGEWTYLLAEHNVTDGEIRLWVCEVGTPNNPAVGEPVKTEATRSATPWSASGAFALARVQSPYGPMQWWPGAIDNVRVFSGKVVAESKIRRLCQGAESTDFSVGALGIDPTSDVAK